MGADLSEVHKKTQQTPLFNAASRGTLQIFVKHRVRGEFSRRHQPISTKLHETAVFYAIGDRHHDITHELIERGASLDVVSTERLSPRAMLSDPAGDAQHISAPSESVKHQTSPEDSCPDASARALLSKWERGQDEEAELNAQVVDRARFYGFRVS